MPITEDSRFQVFTTNLTRDQVARLRRIRDERSTEYNRVTMSDVAREIVQVGLDHLQHVPLSDNITSDELQVPA